MQIQSCSIVVPNQGCINHCKYCVSCMHQNPYRNQIDDNLPFFDLYLKDYIKRLDFARRNGCNTVMLTGNAEPQQNRKFLTYFGMFLQLMQEPFSWIEMQTTGTLLDRNYLRFLRNHVGINLISLSLSAFDSKLNAEIAGMPAASRVKISKLCDDIKDYDFSLRLSLNMNDAFADYPPEELFAECAKLGADQVTIRELYRDASNSPQSLWVQQHALDIGPYLDYIRIHGTPLAILPYGATKYSLHGMSVVCDTDCMAKIIQRDQSEHYKYLILQPNAKLYSDWADPASLIF